MRSRASRLLIALLIAAGIYLFATTAYVSDMGLAEELPRELALSSNEQKAAHIVAIHAQTVDRDRGVGGLCIVARINQKQYQYLLTFLVAISKNRVRPCVYLMATGKIISVQEADYIAKEANKIIGFEMAFVIPVDYSDIQKVSIDYLTDYGYLYTDSSVNNLLKNTKCSHFLFANGDDLYTSGFVDNYNVEDLRHITTRPFDSPSPATEAEKADYNGSLCIVARTYQKQYPKLLTFLLALSQNHCRPCVYLLVTDKSSSIKDVEEIVQKANKLLGYDLASVLPIDYRHANEISPAYETDYGYAYTDAAIGYLLKETTCSYFLFTNGDNLYTSEFIDNYILNDMIQKIDIIGFNFVSRYVGGELPNFYDSSYDDGTRKFVNVRFAVNYIDLGAFIIRADFMRQNPSMRFVTIAQEMRRDWSVSDGLLISHADKIATSRRIHRQILLIHQ